jgi:peptidoglycan/LPS O-acetylase OafA/YrhL
MKIFNRLFAGAKSSSVSDFHMVYRPDIDGLRAIAVLGVVLFHFHPAWLPGGFAGVDVFFVISGYLISLILLAEYSRGEFSYSRFYARRIRRLFPALLLVFLAVIVFGWFALLSDEYELLGRHISSSAVFLANFRLMGEAGYFDIASHLKPLLHLWSLAVEEQFYILWPIVLVFAFRTRTPLLMLLLAMCALSVAFSAWSATQSATLHFYHPLSRFWELGAGCLMAWLRFNGYSIDSSCIMRRWGSTLGLLMLVLSFTSLDAKLLFPGFWALIPVLGTCLCIGCGNGIASAGLGSRPLVAIGLISYPLYLWHWPIFSYLRITEGDEPSLILLIGGAASAVVLSILTYRYFERPLRHSNKRIVLPLMLLAMAWVFVAGRAIRHSDGYPVRGPLEFMRAGLEQTVRTPNNDEDCLDYIGSESAPFYCRLTPGSGSLMAVIGDSHAHVVYMGLAEERARIGKGTLLLANSGCPTLEGTTFGKVASERSACSAQIESILEKVRSNSEIDTVLISTRGPIYITAEGFGPAEAGYSYPPITAVGTEQQPVDVFKTGLSQTAKHLMDAGKKVTYLLQVPEVGIYPLVCLGRPLSFTEKDFTNLCEIPNSVYQQRMSSYRGVVWSAAKEIGFSVFDPEQIYCDGKICSAVRDGKLLYADDNHLSIQGSRELAKVLSPWLLEQERTRK